MRRKSISRCIEQKSKQPASDSATTQQRIPTDVSALITRRLEAATPEVKNGGEEGMQRSVSAALTAATFNAHAWRWNDGGKFFCRC